jgi:hypothetical protein
MKLTLLPIALIAAVNTFAQTTTYPSGVTGCIARYDFSSVDIIGVLPDVSGNGHNGAAHNLVADAGYKNVANTAMRFNGTSSYAQVPDDTSLSPQQVTIIALVKLDTFNTSTCQASQIYSKGYPYYINGSYQLALSDNIYDGSCDVYSPNNQQLNTSMGNTAYSEPAGAYVQPHQWYFFAASYDGNTLKDYQVVMDSTYFDSSVSPFFTVSGLSTSVGTNNIDATIGHHLNPSFPYWFSGSMDELAIFNKVLTDSEMQTVYNYLWGRPGLGIVSVEENNSIAVFPNPTTGNFRISGTVSSNQNAVIELKNVVGRVVYKQEIVVNANKIDKQIVLSPEMANGIYFLSVIVSDQKLTQKVVLDR